MSILAGIWNRDGAPLPAGSVARMGGDGAATWLGADLGLAARLFAVTPESIGDRQPVATDSGLVVLFDGRLDNRRELLTAGPMPGDSPDSELVAAAWERGGESCLATLQGDFAVAVWDRHAQRLWLARDAMGNRPLYYAEAQHHFAFASTVKALFADAALALEPNRALLADILVRGRMDAGDRGETFFHPVYRVLPGQALAVTRAGLQARSFWDFDPGRLDRNVRYEDAAAEMAALLRQAVRRRLRASGPVALAVSGGLDSAVLLCLAVEALGSDAQSRLRAYTYTAAQPAGTQENTVLAALEAACGLSIHRLPWGPEAEAGTARQAAREAESPLTSDSALIEGPLHAAATADGARLLLNGTWSDQFLFLTDYFADLVRRGDWREVWRHLQRFEQYFPDVAPAYFRRRLAGACLRNLPPLALRRHWSAWRQARMQPAQPGWAGAAILALARRPRRRAPLPPVAGAHSRAVYQAARDLSYALTADADFLLTAARGLEAAPPFRDRELIAFLMRTPGEIINHQGVPRALLRDAFAGLLPASARARTWFMPPAEAAAFAARERRRACVPCGSGARASLGLGTRAAMPPALWADVQSMEFWYEAFWPAAANAA